MKDNQFTLGQRLKVYRKINHYTQKTLADKLGISYRTVQQWEVDHSVPNLYTALDLAELYNTTIESIVKEKTFYEY